MKQIIFILFIVILQSCVKKNGCSNSEHVILRNLTGLDGCGWVLELDNGSKLEPRNLNDFNIELVEGKSLHVKTKEVEASAGICMVGKIVDVTCLSED